MRRFLSRFLVLLGALVVWDLAVVSWIGDGMEDLSPSERAAAEEALADLSITCLDNPLQGAFTRHKHVAVGTGPVPCYDDPPIDWYASGPHWPGTRRPTGEDGCVVTIDVYSVFGLPIVRATSDACLERTSCR